MPQWAPSIIPVFSSATGPPAPSSHSELSALLGPVVARACDMAKLKPESPVSVSLSVRACVRFSQVETCDTVRGCLGGMRGCGVGGGVSSPDELVGICKR